MKKLILLILIFNFNQILSDITLRFEARNEQEIKEWSDIFLNEKKDMLQYSSSSFITIFSKSSTQNIDNWILLDFLKCNIDRNLDLPLEYNKIQIALSDSRKNQLVTSFYVNHGKKYIIRLKNGKAKDNENNAVKCYADFSDFFVEEVDELQKAVGSDSYRCVIL